MAHILECVRHKAGPSAWPTMNPKNLHDERQVYRPQTNTDPIDPVNVNQSSTHYPKYGSYQIDHDEAMYFEDVDDSRPDDDTTLYGDQLWVEM